MRLSSFGIPILWSFFIISCGPGKELKSAQARADSLGSTERANSVVRVLHDQYQVTMDRMTSAGRAGNRRTDIILNPDLSRFWDLIDKLQ
jgi:hypothetical protein